jgi:hypothetical protein
MKHVSRKFQIFAAIAVAALVGGGAFAFTSSNTVPTTNVGAGSGTVSGYTVSSIHYALNATTPTNVDSLTFTISPVIPSSSTGKVIASVALTSGGPNTYTCSTDTTGATVTCPTTSPQLTASTITTVTVVAAQ